MKRLAFITLVTLLLGMTPAFAATIGPVKSQASDGDVYLGLGYIHSNADWEEDASSFESLEMEQNQFYGQVGVGFGGGWAAYLRAGVATLDADKAFFLGGDFEGEGAMPFASFGFNGLFFDGEVLDIGPFVQGSYFFLENEDDVLGSADLGIGAEAVRETVTIDKMWEVNAGLGFQVELEGAQLYAGPMFYLSEADIESDVVALSSANRATTKKTIEEEDNFGFILGIQWPLKEGVTLDLEVQKRSGANVGVVLNKTF